MPDRTEEPPCERLGQLVEPLRSEAVLAQRGELRFELGPLTGVCGQPQTPFGAERISCELRHLRKRSLRECPQEARALDP